MQAARSSLANHTSIAELIKDITSEYLLKIRVSHLSSKAGLKAAVGFCFILISYMEGWAEIGFGMHHLNMVPVTCSMASCHT